MKKFLFLISVLSLSISCAPKQAKVEKYLENGVEVVINHLEPYKIKGEPSSLNLDKVFTVDLEREDIAKLGLSDVWTFDVDSEGNVYVLDIRSKKNLIFKFDRNGNFLTSLVRAGQGPGEMDLPFWMEINNHDEIVAGDSGKQKYLILSKNGKLIEEIPIAPKFRSVKPLENGKYLVQWQQAYSSAEEYFPYRRIICDSEFKEIKEIYSRKMANELLETRVRGTYYVFDCKASAKNIYLGDEDRGYEVSVFDLDGNLVRKIRKEFKPVKVTEEFKKKRLEQFGSPEFRRKVYFPTHMPPFNCLMPDDEGRLLVMTYEQGENPGEYLYDIFNPAGVFVGRKSLRLWWLTGNFLSKIKKGRLYGIWEKENGYKELVVYKMRWE